MGDHDTSREPEEVERLQRESEELLAELKAKLNELDRARGGGNGLVTPEQRRRSFRLIKGGAVIVGAIAALKRPAVATAVGGTAAVSAAMLMLAPAYEPDSPLTVDRRPAPVIEPAPMQQAEPGSRAVAEVTEDELEPEPTHVSAEPATEPEPVSVPVPTPRSSLSPKVTAGVTVSPSPSPAELVEIEVLAEDDEACVDSDLVGLELAVCLNR